MNILIANRILSLVQEHKGTKTAHWISSRVGCRKSDVLDTIRDLVLLGHLVRVQTRASRKQLLTLGKPLHAPAPAPRQTKPTAEISPSFMLR